MVIDPDTVVLIGAGIAQQRFDDPGEGVEAIELMWRAVEDAAVDSGTNAVLDLVTWVGVPEGTWSYRNPGALLAARAGRARAAVHTVVADVGILQQDLLTRAIDAVARGTKMALVVGGEAKYRNLRGVITGAPAAETTQGEYVTPDETMTPGSLAALGVHELEITRNTVTPVAAYALIENAIGHARCRSLDEHRDVVADLWAGFASVAADNELAWDRSGPSAAAIRDGVDGNRMISFPYTKRHSAQWNVDQAAALLLCTVRTAKALGIAADQWVFPHASAVANHAVAVTERQEIHRSPGAELAAPRVLELAGIGPDELTQIDCYSCFPSAVELFADALGLALHDPRRLTVTGGLAFAGGPLNNYVLQALVELVRRLRTDGDAGYGLSSSVSGFLVKQGFSVWSARPPGRGFLSDDVTTRVAERATTVDVVGDAHGPGSIATFTVDFAAGEPVRSVVLADVVDAATPQRRARTIVEHRDPAVARALMAEDPIGRAVHLQDGAFELA